MRPATVLDADKIIVSVGRRIAELREQAGLTQQELAEKAEMDQSNIRRIESGKRNLTIRTMTTIANALRCTIQDLLVASKLPRRGPGRPTGSGRSKK